MRGNGEDRRGEDRGGASAIGPQLTDYQDVVARARSLLFVPGDRPDRFAKAAASGADAIVLDLEDAVAVDAKDTARDAAEAWLAAAGPAVVRINGTGTSWHEGDVAMVGRHHCAVMVPKAVNADQLSTIASRLQPGTPLIALVETAAGVLASNELCRVETVVRAAFGSVDLGAELGIDPADHAGFATARSLLTLASAGGGLPAPLDGVTTAVDDDDCLATDLGNALRLGFGGKLCIHPRQVAAVNIAFIPSEGEVSWARRVTEAAAGRGVCVIDGRMVDKPVIQRAERMMAQFRRLGSNGQL